MHNSLAVSLPADKWQTISDRGVNSCWIFSVPVCHCPAAKLWLFVFFFFLWALFLSAYCVKFGFLLWCFWLFVPFLLCLFSLLFSVCSGASTCPSSGTVPLPLHYYPELVGGGFSSFWLWECCHSMDPLKLLFRSGFRTSWWSSGSDSALPMQRVQVPPLIGGLRSYIPCGLTPHPPKNIVLLWFNTVLFIFHWLHSICY